MINSAERIEKSWNRITEWCNSNIADPDFNLGGGATDLDFASLELGLQCQVPEDLKAFLRVHHGDGCRFHAYVEFLTTEQILGERTELQKEAQNWDIEPEVAGPVRCVVWDNGWIPFALIGGASEYHCLDTNPAAGGDLNQVIFVSMKEGERRVIAPSLAEYLERFASNLEIGRLTWFEGAVSRKSSEDGDFWTTGDYVDFPLKWPLKTADEIRRIVTGLQRSNKEANQAFSVAIELVRDHQWEDAIAVFDALQKHKIQLQPETQVLLSVWHSWAAWNGRLKTTAADLFPPIESRIAHEAALRVIDATTDWGFRKMVLDRLPTGRGKQRLMAVQAALHTGDKQTAQSLLAACATEWLGVPQAGNLNQDVSQAELLNLFSEVPLDSELHELQEKIKNAPEPNIDIMDGDTF